MKRYCVLFLMFCSCGAEREADFIVKNIAVVSAVDGLNPKEFEAAIKYTYRGFNEIGIKTKRPEKIGSGYLTITIVPEPISCSWVKSGLCYGVNYGCCDIGVFWNDPCAGKTALVHELVHWVLYWKGMDTDGDHNDERFYGTDGVTNRANRLLTQEFCSE